MKTLDTFIALNRFGLGAAPGEPDLISDDPRGWIRQQINSTQQTPPELQKFSGSNEILRDIHAARKQDSKELKRVTRKKYQKNFQQEVIARTHHMISTDQPFVERMVLFWSNHFTVSRTKRIIGPAIPAYEREAIRPHVFGRFADMLKAVSRHPCMLSYLDNVVSMGENSRAGKRRIKRKGNKGTLNENLAREILELHTLGVNGGYAQNDVIELAKAISGWSHGGVGRRRNAPIDGRFRFNPAFHEPGAKTILGKTYQQDGPDQGLTVLDDLARHRSTATFIATKLVRHFVADDPPAKAVSVIANVFRDTDGDLSKVAQAIIDLPQVWSDPIPKVKTHYEFLVATHRACANKQPARKDIAHPLQEFGQQPFAAPSPQGWGDTARHWIAPESLMHRIEWLRRYTSTLPPTLYPSDLLENTIGPVASPQTRTWVSRAPSGDAALAMVLGSPEFQRR